MKALQASANEFIVLNCVLDNNDEGKEKQNSSGKRVKKEEFKKQISSMFSKENEMINTGCVKQKLIEIYPSFNQKDYVFSIMQSFLKDLGYHVEGCMMSLTENKAEKEKILQLFNNKKMIKTAEFPKKLKKIGIDIVAYGYPDISSYINKNCPYLKITLSGKNVEIK